MPDKNDGGDKTERPTPRRLRDARKKGDIAKSRDLTSTAGLVAWLLLLVFAGSIVGERMAVLFEQAFQATASGNGSMVVAEQGWAALRTFLILSILALLPMAVIGLLAEFLQAGPVLSFEKMKPKLDQLNPVEGLKRMISTDNLVELLKTMVKALVLIGVTGAVIWLALPDLLSTLPATPLTPEPGAGRAQAMGMIAEHGRLALQLIFFTLGAFLLVAALDVAWQRHSYIKKLRMSLRDIRDEIRQDEGDPHVKGQRKQLHQEYAENNAVHAARDAHALVVNPTHLAVALDYDPEMCPLPVVAAIGEGPLAAAMRAAAEEEGVPIIRHVQAARDLRARALVGDVIPRDLFEVVAEVIAWARKEREASVATAGRAEHETAPGTPGR